VDDDNGLFIEEWGHRPGPSFSIELGGGGRNSGSQEQ
jgi:hypothetical protein